MILRHHMPTILSLNLFSQLKNEGAVPIMNLVSIEKPPTGRGFRSLSLLRKIFAHLS